MKSQKKFPTQDSLKKVRKIFKELYQKPPTDELMELLCKIEKKTDAEKPNTNNKHGAPPPRKETDL